MKRTLSLFLFLSTLLAASFTLAQTETGAACDWNNTTQLCNPLKYGNFNDLLEAIINFIFTIGIIVAPLLLIIAGFLFVTSAGKPENVKTAKTMVIAALVGVAVLALAKGLVKVIVSILEPTLK